jgi:hypothetical protein
MRCKITQDRLWGSTSSSAAPSLAYSYRLLGLKLIGLNPLLSCAAPVPRRLAYLLPKKLPIPLPTAPRVFPMSATAALAGVGPSAGAGAPDEAVPGCSDVDGDATARSARSFSLR